MKNSIKILGVPFSTLNTSETVDLIEHKVKSDDQIVFHIITGNPEIVLKSQEDASLKRIIDEADIITPDGVGIVLASKWKGKSLTERVTGCDLLPEILKKGNSLGWSFYFLGTDEETSSKAVENIIKIYPNIRVSGRHNGFFTDKEEQNIIKEIGYKKPDILIVALGAPKAEKWIYNYKAGLPVKVAIGVGGSLDVLAGKVKRAPEIWQRLNLEWLHRLITQPSRWRRQLVLPIFAYKSLVEAIYEKFEVNNK